jgi:hypothetical protein
MKRPIACTVVVLALSLTGCGWFGGDKAAQGGTAQGEVLPGSVSDAMIPIDQIKSQAPLAPKSEGGGEKADGKAAAKDKPKAASAAAPAEPEPAEAPAAED